MKILFLYEKNKCYDSFRYFTECIKAEFDRLGYETAIAPIGDKEKAIPDLVALYDTDYDYVIDVAGAFLNKRDSDGEYCYNRIPGRKIHYVIDHPLYLRKILSCPLKRTTCVCIDNNHADYIRRFYPHIEDVIVDPLGGATAQNQPAWEKRRNNLLFSGTYSSPELILKQVKSEDEEFRQLFFKMTALLLDEPSLTQEEALEGACNSLKIRIDDFAIPKLLERLYLADVYLRAVIREEVILACLRKGINVDVYGFGWELFLKKLSLTEPSLLQYINVKGQVPYRDTPKLFSEYKFVLNHMPWFKDGLHDRVPMAVMNGCVCFTDGTPYLEKIKNNKKIKNIIFYFLDDMDEGAETIRRIMEDGSSYEEGFGSGSESDDNADKAAEECINAAFSWEGHVKKLIAETGIM